MDLMINRFIYTSIYCRIGIKDGFVWLSMTQIEVIRENSNNFFNGFVRHRLDLLR